MYIHEDQEGEKNHREDDDSTLCFIDAVASPKDNFELLKGAILVLFVALFVVTVMLFYFVKKKVMMTGPAWVSLFAKWRANQVISDPWVSPQKAQYQPQLQMIQVVGPNDNDYIYINFKDLEYDTKWEFPRENLELGMNHTRQERRIYKHTLQPAESPGVPTALPCAVR